MKTVVSGVRLPPEWLPTSSTGPRLGDVPQAAHLAAEVQRRQQPQAGQLLADVVGVALVEVGGRDAACEPGRRDAPERGGVGRIRPARERLLGRVAVAASAPARRGRSALMHGGSASAAQAAAACRAAGARGRRARRRRAKKRASRPLVCSGARPAGTWPQPSSTICSARGQPLGHVALEAGRDQLVVRGPRRTARARWSSARRG